jgi:hypothetical protein
MASPEENVEEAVILEVTAKNLFDQSEVLMKQARDLRAESMKLRRLALQLRPQKNAAPKETSHV